MLCALSQINTKTQHNTGLTHQKENRTPTAEVGWGPGHASSSTLPPLCSAMPMQCSRLARNLFRPGRQSPAEKENNEARNRSVSRFSVGKEPKGGEGHLAPHEVRTQPKLQKAPALPSNSGSRRPVATVLLDGRQGGSIMSPAF